MHMRSLTKKVFTGLSISLFAFSVVFASGLNSEQINAILTMLRAFGADAATVAQVEATLKGNATYNTGGGQSSNTSSGGYGSSVANANISCPSLYRNLHYGMRGDDVVQLQRFLKELGDYTYPEITGYFGMATQAAIQRFQARLGIVSSGTPATTGFGSVGPQTRAKIQSLCAGGWNAGGAGALKNFSVTPKLGSVPFTPAVTFEYKGSNCTAFTLDWGDGSTPIVQYAQSSSCDDYTVRKTARHTYVKDGEYTITLSVTNGSKSDTYTEKVTVGKTAAQHFDVSPTSGDAPLTVGVSFAAPDNECTAYKLDWGDGSYDSKNAQPQAACDTSTVKVFALTHTYKNQGRYTLKLHLGSNTDAESAPLVEQREINVKASSVSGNQSRISVNPTAGNVPLIVKVRIEGEGEACTGYEINWGDGTASQTFEAQDTECDTSNFIKEFVHTYFIPGTYTLKAKAGHGKLGTLPYEYQYITVQSGQ